MSEHPYPPPSTTPDWTATAGLAPGSAAAPASAPAEVRAEAAHPAQPGLATPPRRRSAGMLVLAVIGFVVLGVVALLVALYLLAGLGLAGLVIGAIMALVPLAIVFAGIRWIDRWEPEPRGALVFAFLWGAGMSVLIALLVDAEIRNVVAMAGGPPEGFEFFGAAVQAPIVEELGKGLGVLILFWAVRRHFDGPVDGIVYAATVAGGFAFTENILYFGTQLAEDGLLSGGTIEIFLVRGLMSPFAHVMFTAFIGAAIGFAARRAGALAGLGLLLVGAVPAILLHAFWNGALFFVGDFYGYYVLVQVPMFLVAVVIVIALRKQEQRLTAERLGEYAAVGWLHPQEVAVLATPAGRRTAQAWAARHGVPQLMRAFIRDATRLAHARQRILGGREGIGAHVDEAELLQRVAASRHALMWGRATP
ncbi:PrsW family intramembrane metalloprotease [Microcella alkalica]|uniref:RsiW-degrading membrane proteinase PrsW (M82 family) n=1 Tax=Microcella alkalica TaxID=355930 RepID=A0A839E5C8_9MICO|nr:PrsW family intramembrane metalloprotease [Microcella alkalica]MBA8847581.1 RsiW-degrading membrane proteinase PrsW (M82 family) [Microcella alkalica]